MVRKNIQVPDEMTRSRIRVLPFNSSVPYEASLPIAGVRQWISAHEVVGNAASFSVFFTQNAFRQTAEHTSSDLEQEVGGVLVGKYCVDSVTSREYIIIKAVLPARFTEHGSVYLTFTQDSLVDIHATMDETYPEEVIVGWYHTHPHMGVFLSQYDTWLHKHFFPEPWQVALVIEPNAKTGGFFLRQAEGELDPDNYYGFYEMDDLSGESIVFWNNLQQRPAQVENKGVDLDE
jgi:proteasome lid subunit RPN8/RPN11